MTRQQRRAAERRIAGALDSLAPRLRQVAPIDSAKLGIPIEQVAYYVGIVRDRASMAPLGAECSEQRAESFCDTYSLSRLQDLARREFPETLQAIHAPVTSGCVRVLLHGFDTISVHDVPVVVPNSLGGAA